MSAPTTGDDYAACAHDGETRCKTHGGLMRKHSETCQTHRVLDDVRAERARQFAQYGTNADIEDGTGPEVEWLGDMVTRPDEPAMNADEIEQHLRLLYEGQEALHGKPTWRHLVLEEMAEVFKEAAPLRLRAELIQVAGLAVSWIEKIDARIPKWEAIEEFEPPEPGDLAFKKGTDLDAREVAEVFGDLFWLHVGAERVGPCEVAEYTFKRRVV